MLPMRWVWIRELMSSRKYGPDPHPIHVPSVSLASMMGPRCVCVCAEPTFMQCMLGTRPYRHIFSEAYFVLAAIAGVCVIPLLRVMLRQ